MGESSAQTVREIEETRDRLDAELRELEHRMPQPAVWAKRAVGFLVGGGTAATVTLFLLKRRKKKRKEEQRRERGPAVIQVLPDRWAEQVSERLSDGAWKPFSGGSDGTTAASTRLRRPCVSSRCEGARKSGVAAACRVERAKFLLERTELPVTGICFSVGFESLGSFSSWFTRLTGSSPRAWRSGSKSNFEEVSAGRPRLTSRHEY